MYLQVRIQNIGLYHWTPPSPPKNIISLHSAEGFVKRFVQQTALKKMPFVWMWNGWSPELLLTHQQHSVKLRVDSVAKTGFSFACGDVLSPRSC